MFEIKTNTRKFTVKDDREEEYFNVLVSQLLCMMDSSVSMQVQKQTRSIDTMKEPLAEPVVKKKPESDKNKSVKLEGRETSSEEEKLDDVYTTRRGDKVNGLLFFFCEHCGGQSVVNAKGGLSEYTCRHCGETNVLRKDAFRMAYVNCECGMNSFYKTNSLESMFDADCLKCKSLVSVQWNSKKKYYETIKDSTQ